jgi:hypothetical protein
MLNAAILRPLLDLVEVAMVGEQGSLVPSSDQLLITASRFGRPFLFRSSSGTM